MKISMFARDMMAGVLVVYFPLMGHCKTFEQALQDVSRLDIAPLRLAYVDNLNAIGDVETLAKQEAVFKQILAAQPQWQDRAQSLANKIDIDLLMYEASINLERISLARKWITLDNKHVSNQGLAHSTMGKDWYRYFLKRWVDQSATPENIIEFGYQEVERVAYHLAQAKASLKQLQQTNPQKDNDAPLFLTSKQAVHAAFLAEQKHINKAAQACFPYLDEVPEVIVRAGTNPRLAQTPGYYGNNQFSYNFFDAPYDIKQVAWLYVHEAIPGHHYQLSMESLLPKTKAQTIFSYSSYREGWAAYVEELGKQCGFYDSIEDEIGKWEWDMIRSVRIVLDVALNFYGWTDEKALAYWQTVIPDKDDIALREIARMKRWPAQVITYKFGADALLKLKSRLNVSNTAQLKTHHKALLRLGPMPFSVLDSYL